VLQTSAVVIYGLFISYQKQKIVQAGEKTKLQFCNFALLLFSLSAVDYLCNYGFDFYPPGVVFIALALGLIALATAKYHAMDDSRMMAASLAHEMRTPLATLRIQAKVLGDNLPELIDAYQKARQAGLISGSIDSDLLSHLNESARILEKEVVSANHAIDMLMALATADYINEKDFQQFSMKECVELVVCLIRRA
jgi:signal transduction histidine kinase